MIVFFIIGIIAGIMFGLRFTVLVLVPAILLATAVITVTGIGSAREAGAIALTVFGTTASLQIGYFAGCILCGMVRAHPPAGRRPIDDLPQAGLSPSMLNGRGQEQPSLSR